MKEYEQIEKEIARQSVRIYLPIALGAAGLFLLASQGDYPPVARVGGAVWVGLLSLIVAMPLVISRVKRHRRNKGSGSPTR